jgi:cytochrome c556
MDALRAEQGKYKAERSKTFDEMKRLQEGVQRKIKEVQAQRGKLAYRSVGEIDERIK